MKLKRISEASMQEIVKAFSEYQYEAQEEGLYYLCKGKSGTEAYMKGFALAGIKSGWLHNEIEMISPDKLHIAPCKGCKACQCHKGCVDQDDTNPTIDKIAAADMILFATPVYWWGMTAQLKLVIDKCYCRGLQLKGKKVGIIVTGGAPVDNVQYELIRKQFECMAGYLSWEVLFFKTYSANAKDELEKNTEAMEELEKLGQDVK